METVALVRSSVRALDAGDVDGYLSGFTDDCPRWVPGMADPVPLSDIGENSRQLLVAFDGFHLHEVGIFGVDSFVCAHWRLTGTHTGEYLGIAPTHRSIAIENAEVYQFASADGGPISSTWSFGDPMAFFRALGVEP
jgi:hypothetical protein